MRFEGAVLVLWTAYDPLGRSVAFTNQAQAHIEFEHPDLASHIGVVRTVIADPDIITRELDGSFNYYRGNLIPRRLGRYLNVLVRPSAQADYEVKTAWQTNLVDRYEERLW